MKEFAVIETGGKQYKVSVGDTVTIEKLAGAYKEGDTITFENVLLVDNGTNLTTVGDPYIKGASVEGTLSEAGRGKKVIVHRYKSKSRYSKKKGHRQPYFKVKITALK